MKNTYEFFEAVKHVYGARITQRYSAELRAGRSRFRIPAGAGNFSLHH